MPATLTVHCPPKINLYLRIVRRREDGYHELETVFQSVGGGDTLSGSPHDRLALTSDEPEMPLDDRNLVLKAARLLQSRYPQVAAKGAALHLQKQTPMGAGMGGGSVDAAAALGLLCRLWDLSVPPEELHSMAAGLGSDVPFFLRGGTALARGRGEVLESLPTPPLWLVLLRPPVSVGTPWAYRQWNADACAGATLDEFIAALHSGEPQAVAGTLRNDLEPGVAAGVPEISSAREWLLRQGVLGARMTGSGSVVFGVCRDEAHAQEIAARSGAPGRIWVAPTLTTAQAALTVKGGG